MMLKLEDDPNATGTSLHNVMSAPRLDLEAHEKAINGKLEPRKVGEGSMAYV